MAFRRDSTVTIANLPVPITMMDYPKPGAARHSPLVQIYGGGSTIPYHFFVDIGEPATATYRVGQATVTALSFARLTTGFNVIGHEDATKRTKFYITPQGASASAQLGCFWAQESYERAGSDRLGIQYSKNMLGGVTTTMISPPAPGFRRTMTSLTIYNADGFNRLWSAGIRRNSINYPLWIFNIPATTVAALVGPWVIKGDADPALREEIYAAPVLFTPGNDVHFFANYMDERTPA